MSALGTSRPDSTLLADTGRSPPPTTNRCFPSPRSSAGLLPGPRPTPPPLLLVFTVWRPAEISGLAAGAVVFRGEVVRAVKTEAGTVSPTLAAKILQYHFQHGSHLSQA